MNDNEAMCLTCKNTLQLVSTDVGTRWVHVDGPMDHEPQPMDALDELTTGLLGVLTRTSLVLHTGGPDVMLSMILLPTLIERAQKIIDFCEANPGGHFAAVTTQMGDNEAKIWANFLRNPEDAP